MGGQELCYKPRIADWGGPRKPFEGERRLAGAEDARERAEYVVLELEGEGFKVGGVSEDGVQVLRRDVAEGEGAKQVEVDDVRTEARALEQTFEGF